MNLVQHIAQPNRLRSTIFDRIHNTSVLQGGHFIKTVVAELQDNILKTYIVVRTNEGIEQRIPLLTIDAILLALSAEKPVFMDASVAAQLPDQKEGVTEFVMFDRISPEGSA